MTGPRLRARAPQGEPLTDYDRDHVALYLRLLDAEEAGADWREVAKSKEVGLTDAEVEQFAPAFEHDEATAARGGL
jgi:hypothetical protein